MNVRGLFCVVENDHTAERESFLHWSPAGTSRNKSIFCLLQTKNSRTWCFLSLENFQASIVALAYRAQKEELRPSSRQLLVVFEVVSSDVWRSRGWDQASLGLQMPKFVHAVLCTNVIIYIKCAIICSSRKASPPQISVLFSKTGARRKTGLFPWRGFASSPCVCVLWVVFFFFVGLHSKDDTDQVNGVSKMTDTVGVNVCKLLPFNVSWNGPLNRPSCFPAPFFFFLAMNSSRPWRLWTGKTPVLKEKMNELWRSDVQQCSPDDDVCCARSSETFSTFCPRWTAFTANRFNSTLILTISRCKLWKHLS